MADVNSCPGRMRSLQDIYAAVGVPKLSWALGPEEMGRDGSRVNTKLATRYYLNVRDILYLRDWDQ